MLDLDARVQLEEPELAAGQHELGRAGALVADRARERDRRVAHRGAQRRIERRRRRLLEHLLVAALHRALALAERDDGAVRVGEQLDLHMPRPLEIALAEDRVVPERGPGLAPCGSERFVELVRRADDAHAASASTGGRLDQQREADLLRRPARQHRDTGRARSLLRGELVAAGPKRGRRRSDPCQSGGEHRLRESGALGEEAVPGVHRVGVRLECRAHDLRRVEIRRDRDGRVRRAGMERAGVVGRDHGDRLDAE